MRNLSRVGAAVIISTAALMAACNQQTEDSHATSPSTSAAAVAKTMHPSWDADQDGINDCENDGSCDHTVDYSQPRPSIAPTFDCTKTDSSIETLICQDSELAALDIKLAAVYAAASQKVQEQEQQSPLLTTGQRGWIKGRNDCWKADDKKGCAKTEYQRRIAELQAHYQLVESIGPIRFQCGDSPADELIVTFYESDSPTLIAERGDSVSLMYQVPAASGSKYEGRNESFWEHQGEARVVWGYDTPEFVCKTTP